MDYYKVPTTLIPSPLTMTTIYYWKKLADNNKYATVNLLFSFLKNINLAITLNLFLWKIFLLPGYSAGLWLLPWEVSFLVSTLQWYQVLKNIYRICSPFHPLNMDLLSHQPSLVLLRVHWLQEGLPTGMEESLFWCL